MAATEPNSYKSLFSASSNSEVNDWKNIKKSHKIKIQPYNDEKIESDLWSPAHKWRSDEILK